MRKILVGLIAAMMLFAFVACDNSTNANFGNSVVTKIEVTSAAPSIFVGDTVAESSLTVVGTYLDGSTFTVPESDFTFTQTPAANLKDVNSGELTTIGTVSYDGYSYGGSVDNAVVEGYVYSVDKLVVEGPSTPESYYYIFDTAATFTSEYNAANYTVTAQALDEDDNVIYSRELVYVADEDATGTFVADATSEYKVTPEKTASSATPGAGTLKFERNSKYTAVGSSNTAAAVTEPIACQADRVVRITVSAKEGTEFIAGTALSTITSNATTNFEAKNIYQSGYEAPLTTFSVAFDAAIQAADELPVAGSTVTVTASSGTLTATTPITTIANYITSFEAAYTNGKVVKPGDSLVRDYVTISNVEWANKTVGAPDGFTATFALSREDMPSTVATNGSWTYVVTLTNPEAAKEAPYAYMTVNAGTTTSPAEN